MKIGFAHFLILLFFVLINQAVAQGLPAQWAWADFSSEVVAAPGGGFNQAKEINWPDTINGQVYIPHGLPNSLGYYKSDILLIRYNALNLPLWAVAIGGNGTEYFSKLTVDVTGKVIITGSYTDTVNFSAGSVLPSSGGKDLFFASYDSTGAMAWVTALATSGSESCDQQVQHPSGGVYQLISITNLASPVDVGPYTLSPTLGKLNVFAYLNGSGQWQWASELNWVGGTLKTDMQGSCFLSSIALPDSFLLGGAWHSNTTRAALLAKFDSNGNLSWFKTLLSPTGFIRNLIFNPGGNLEIRVAFNSSLTLDTVTISAPQFIRYWVKLSSVGQILGYEPDTLSNYQQLAGLPSGDQVFAGYFSDSLFYRNKIIFQKPGFNFYVARIHLSDTTFWLADLNNAHGGVAIKKIEVGYNNEIFINGSTSDSLEIDTLLFSYPVADPPTEFWARLKLSSPPAMAASDNLQPETGFCLFPNPASQSTSIRFKDPLSCIPKIQVFDSLGRIIKEPLGTGLELNLAGLTSGLYQVRVLAGQNCWYQKLIVE